MSLLKRLQSHPKAGTLQKYFRLGTELVLEKVAGYIQKPGQYPLPADPKSAERAVYAFIKALPDKRERKFVKKYEDRLGLSAAQRKNLYGHLSSVDLKSAIPVAEQIKGIKPPASEMIKEAESVKLRDIIKGNIVKPPAKMKPSVLSKAVKKLKPAEAPAAAVITNEVSFIVDSLTCVKNSEIRKDEIHLGGFAVDPAQVQQDKAPFFVGKFKKGQTIGLGANSNLFTLQLVNDSVGGFPAAFTTGLFLQEEDIIHNTELADKLSIVCFVIWGIGMAVVAGLIVWGASGGPVTPALAMLVLAVSLTFLVIGLQVIPLMADDISSVFTDTLILESAPSVGDRFDVALEFGLENLFGDFTKGKYTGVARWEVTA